MKLTFLSPRSALSDRLQRRATLALALGALAFATPLAARVEVRYSRGEPAIAHAGAELSKYLDKLETGERNGVIELGLFSDRKLNPFPDLADAALDDAIVVDVTNGSGFIAGSNPRAVLLGVYRYLGELGFRWIRPGAEGEVIPAKAARTSVSLQERASARNRTVCIEGAVSLTNVLDIVEWMPKAGFNGFMMQFRDGYTFFDRWYSHEENLERKRAQPLERGVAQEYTVLIERELARRNLIYHAVGHGWHLEAYGVPALGWIPRYDLPKEFLDKVALVNGARAVPWNIPNLAALCYSDPEVQARMTASIVDYARTHRQVDYLHVWLDDCTNNKCECERCRTKNPSDWYFQLLNRLDAELTAQKLDTHIVFIAYCELLWGPKDETLQHPERFSFVYANGRSDYTKPLDAAHKHTPLPEFRLNRVPPETSENKFVAAYLHDWNRRFAGDRMLFEYWGGAETLSLAKVAWNDLKSMPDWGLNGMINCQSLRVWFPNGFGMTVIGRTMWNRDLDFAEMARDYFAAAYGQDATSCYEFTAKAQSAVADITRLLKEQPSAVHAAAQALQAEIRAFSPVVQRNLSSTQGAQNLSWRMMRDYLKILGVFAEHSDAKTIDAGQPSQFIRSRFQQLILGLEDEYQPYLQPGEHLNRYAK